MSWAVACAACILTLLESATNTMVPSVMSLYDESKLLSVIPCRMISVMGRVCCTSSVCAFVEQLHFLRRNHPLPGFAWRDLISKA
ncbi:hypothetical protein F5J12DRAFT_241940 [Pisolithus orientalis]|uniref:uncharacterized protein n=1 Tax=Pisolithus orientalis TaxID=936130 RepID=UPI00222485C8|nr:uncharacterized protein F5J12DRAFT_241940 [Pisolithus orientalis]KAI6001682.1 hypothetical protein F5J12DRAFT_241940 [Pisolithus orientalis]